MHGYLKKNFPHFRLVVAESITLRPTSNVVLTPCRTIFLWHGSGTTSEVDIFFNAVLQSWHITLAVPVVAITALSRQRNQRRATTM